MISVDEELRRLNSASELAPDGLGLWLTVQCEDPTELLRATIGVLSVVVDKRCSGRWPDLHEWRSTVLPTWFSKRFRDEWTAEREAAWLAEWRLGDDKKRLQMENAAGWSLADWLYWFEPGHDERQWRWAAGIPTTTNIARVGLSVDGIPVAYGALTWLLECAGGQSITEFSNSDIVL